MSGDIRDRTRAELRADAEGLRDFGNALREFLDLEPLYEDGRSIDREGSERRFYVAPFGTGLGLFGDGRERTPCRRGSDEARPGMTYLPPGTERANERY